MFHRIALSLVLTACLGLFVHEPLHAQRTGSPSANQPRDRRANTEAPSGEASEGDSDAGSDSDAVPVDRSALEEEFAKTMSGARLVGFYTTDGREAEKGLVEETYRLRRVSKLDRGDYWRFEFQYGEGEKAPTIPLNLRIKWAGDTPVITLTDAAVPLLGTYSARVLFYRGHYAGTWSASDHGGKLFGRIEQDEPAPEESADKPSDDSGDDDDGASEPGDEGEDDQE